MSSRWPPLWLTRPIVDGPGPAGLLPLRPARVQGTAGQGSAPERTPSPPPRPFEPPSLTQVPLPGPVPRPRWTRRGAAVAGPTHRAITTTFQQRGHGGIPPRTVGGPVRSPPCQRGGHACRQGQHRVLASKIRVLSRPSQSMTANCIHAKTPRRPGAAILGGQMAPNHLALAPTGSIASARRQ